jgi:hypothetical protein
MKFLEGKTPAERNKIIIAIVLGGLAVIALSYTLSGFLFSPKKIGGPGASPTPTPTGTPQELRAGSNDPSDPSALADVAWMLTTPITYAQNAFSSDAGRNIFAFYEPPPPTPYSPTPVVIAPPPLPTPTPTPPFTLTYVSPSAIYAGSKTFRMEVMGDKFTPEARILFNGSELPTNFINAQKLTADVPAVLIAGEGPRQIMIRTPDGKGYSLPAMMQVQAAPVPNFEYIGLVEKKHRNNDMAILKEKGKTEVASFRLNDTVGDRFRLISISSREVILEDRSLGFRHRLPFSEGKSSGGGAVGGSFITNSPQGRGGQGAFPPYMSNPNSPNPTIPPGEIPGIPGNVQRYVPPNANTNRQTTKKDYEDDDDGDNRQQ